MADSGRHGAGTYQMLWDCKYCGTQKLLGVTHRHCPNCGAAQDPAWRYFPAEADMIALEDHKYVGADKICLACRQPNSAANTYCTECGADLATGEIAPTQADREIGTGAAESDTRRDVVKESFEAEMQRVGAAGGAQAIFLGLRKKQWWTIAGVALLALIVVGGIYALTYRKSAAGAVEKLTWQRTVEIEDFQPRAGGGWRDSLPGDAYDRRCYEKQRGTRRVESGSHQECKDVDQGDGSFRRECSTVKEYREEPVYDTWCDYRVDRWAYSRKVIARGEGKSPPPEWPAFTLAGGLGRYGAEREGRRYGEYAVIIREDGGNTHTCEFGDQAAWAQYDVGARVTLKLYITGGADCGSLTLAR